MKSKIRFFFLLLTLKIGTQIMLGSDKNIGERPNILFFIFDDASYQHFSANGSKWVKTPGFDKVSSQGIRFTNYYTPNAKCAPSRSCILTGRYPWQLKEAANHIPIFPVEFKVFTEVLQDNNYMVAYTGKPWGPGIAKTNDNKERNLTGKKYATNLTNPSSQSISRNNYTANFLDFLDDVPAGQPWFFWCGGWEPHRPYEFKSSIKYGGKNTSEIDTVPAYWPDVDSVRIDILDYAYELEYFDQHILSIIKELENKGQLDNTIVVITSDNGMPFPRSKGCSFEISNHMPMAMMWKNKITYPGRIIQKYHTSVELAATFLELCGVDCRQTGMKRMAGKSFKKELLTKPTDIKNKGTLLFGRERNDFGRPNNQGYPSRSIMKDDYLYILNLKNDRYPAGNPETGYLDCDGSPTKTVILNQRRAAKESIFWHECFGFRPYEELYDLSKDKDCVNNLAQELTYAQIKEQLKKELIRSLIQQEDPRFTGRGDIFDSYPYMLPEYSNFWEQVWDREIKNPASKTKWVEPSDYE